jgi:uncharacterized protein (TIGR03083 family)
MESEQFLVVLADASDAVAIAAADAGTDAPVPSCPGWTVTDLLLHLVAGDRWARTIAEERSVKRVPNDTPADHPSGAALVPWYRAEAQLLVTALAELDPTTSVWTFCAADRTAQFWRRRRAHEATVHRYDAQLAAGAPQPIDLPVAVDGIDEFLTVFVPRFPAEVLAEGTTLHLHCTDAEGEWLLTGTAEGVEVGHEHAKGDVAARGGASDLLLYLWGRVPKATLEVFGDAGVLENFRARSHI